MESPEAVIYFGSFCVWITVILLHFYSLMTLSFFSDCVFQLGESMQNELHFLFIFFYWIHFKKSERIYLQCIFIFFLFNVITKTLSVLPLPHSPNNFLLAGIVLERCLYLWTHTQIYFLLSSFIRFSSGILKKICSELTFILIEQYKLEIRIHKQILSNTSSQPTSQGMAWPWYNALSGFAVWS